MTQHRFPDLSISEKDRSELYRRNTDALRRSGHEAVADKVDALRETLVRQHGSIDLTPLQADGSPLYAPDAETAVSAQLAQYRQTPTRHFLSINGVPANFKRVTHDAMREIMSNLQGQFLNTMPDQDAGHMLCFGVGLGLHLPHLAADFDFLELVILEPNLTYLLQSLHVLDWASLIERLEAEGRSLTLLHAEEPLVLARAVLIPLRSRHLPQLDGMFVFTHYSSAVMDRTFAEVRTLLPVIEANDGFFEDEQLMLEQAVDNCLKREHHLLYDRADRGLKEIPVFVVGAGPSLDDMIDDIRRNRENVILISCSTSLRPLLSAGLVPDFHSEVENTKDAATIIQDAAADFDISDIVLLATNTVRPEVVEPFKRRVMYWRESVISSRLFSKLDHYLNMAGPSVANLAVRAGISMGFYEFYLFGVDMGARDPSQHHASGSIYYDRDDEYWQSGAHMQPFSIPLPGNMRETVYTNASFLLCKIYLDRLFQTFTNRFFFNCSDGVKLERATGMIASTLNAEPPDKPRGDIVDDCLAEMEFCRPGDQIDRARLQEYRDALADWFNTAMDATRNEDLGTMRQLIHAFYPLLGSSSFMARFTVDSAIRGLCTGTVISILQFGHFFERRLAQADRPRFMAVFRQALENALRDMQEQGLGLADDLLARMDG